MLLVVDPRMQGEVFLIRLVFAVVATAMAVVEIVPAVRNVVAVSPVFRGDLEGVKTMAYLQVQARSQWTSVRIISLVL